jgi:hypothetical protein
MIPAVPQAGSNTRGLFLACAVGCALAAAGSAFGQTPSSGATPSTAHGTAPSPFGAITGVVVDSLHGRPLSGAQISVEGLNTLAMTDSIGRFRIDSVPPGKYRIGVFHPLLDSLGLSIASPQLRVAADSTLSVIFATPSALTFIRLVCGTIQIDTMAGIGPSVVIGRVLDAETEAPAGGVKVTLMWTDIQAGANIGVHRIQRVRDTTTAPSGEFRFCHLPPGLNGVARVAAGKDDSGAVSRPLTLNGRLVVPLVLHVPGTAKPAANGTTNGTINTTHGTASPDGSSLPSAGSVLTGRVTRSDGTGPFAGAQVTVLGSRVTTVTDDSGAFTLRGLPAGSRTLAVRAVGWEPVTIAVDLAAHEPRQVVVPLRIKTATLQAVVVTAALNAGLRRVGFDSRKHMGIGHFLGPDDIEQRGPFEFVDIMNGMAGIARHPGPNGEDYLTGTRGGSACVSYVVDGTPYVEMTQGDINTFLRPEQVGAVEVYQAGESPAQYAYSPRQSVIVTEVVPGNGRSVGTMGSTGARGGAGGAGGTGGGTSCVKIVVWTKARLGL